MPFDEDDEAQIQSLQYQKAFGSTLKRKRIDFVPASRASLENNTLPTPARGKQVQDAYLNMVLKTDKCDTKKADPSASPEICPICKSAILEASHDAHNASMVHLLAKDHSHPPSSIDRQNKGFAYLNSQGWNPDDRRGLGAEGNGILYPIRTEDRGDKRGLGASKLSLKEKQRERRLTAGQARKQHQDGVKKDKRMQALFYGKDDVNKYLGIE